eukprot:15431476-Alexandrium_andersonii.AAC.1
MQHVHIESASLCEGVRGKARRELAQDCTPRRPLPTHSWPDIEKKMVRPNRLFSILPQTSGDSAVADNA